MFGASMNDVTFLTEIPKNEQKQFDVYVQAARKTFILSPKETVKTIGNHHDLSVY
jgi:hypothetical protein